MSGNTAYTLLREHKRPLKVEHPSFVLPHIAAVLETRSDCRVLDLGAPCEANIKFYGRFARKFYFEDLSSALSIDGSAPASSISEELEKLRDQSTFDLVMCWDLINYLSHDELAELSEALAECTGEHTILYAQLSVRPQIAVAPGLFKIVSPERIAYEPRANSFTPVNRHTKMSLGKRFTGFKRVRSYLLRHGMEEYLFRSTAQDARPAAAQGFSSESAISAERFVCPSSEEETSCRI